MKEQDNEPDYGSLRDEQTKTAQGETPYAELDVARAAASRSS